MGEIKKEQELINKLSNVVRQKNFEAWTGVLEKLAADTGKDYFKACDLMKSGGFAKMRK